MSYIIRVTEPARDPHWRVCTHRVDADSWFALAAREFQPDTEIRLIDSEKLVARVTVLTPFIATPWGAKR